MINVVIALLVLLFNIAPLYVTTRRARTRAWQWWPEPWMALLFVGIMCVVYLQVNFASLPIFNLLDYDYQIEAAYVLLCQFLWLIVSFILRRIDVHNILISWFRNAFAPEREDRDTVLPFPYFIDHEKVVRSLVGKAFYRQLLSALVVIVACFYALFFLLVEYLGIDFLPLSALCLFGLLPLADYCHYLKAVVPEEKDKPGEGGGDNQEVSDLEKLWQLYTETFPDYSVAWKRKNNYYKEADRDNQSQLEDLMERLTGTVSKKGVDGYLENCDLVSAFLRMEPLFNWEEENGRLILLVLDIPNHFSQDTRQSYLQDIAEELKQILRKDLIVYDEFTPNIELNSSIVLASLNVLSQRDLEKEWLGRLGLVIVVNLFDKSLSNLYECRKFSNLLRANNEQHQLLFITPHLRGVEPSLKNVWLTSAHTVEKRQKQVPSGINQYFIGYDIEGYLDRFKLILQPLPNEPLTAGSEMAPIALSYKVGDELKAVTPVHFFDLAYTNIIEGIEELGKFYNNRFIPVRDDDINKHIHSHLLPVDRIGSSQTFSVIFDQDNNAPAAYLRWIHIGHSENFSVVLSRPYLLRDYFNANHDYFVKAPFIALQPHLSKSRITLAVILLEMLQKSAMTEQQLRGLLQGYFQEEEVSSVSSVVQQLFTTYFMGNLAGRLKTSYQVEFDGSCYQYQTIYRLDFSDSVNLSYLDRIAVKDESDNVLFFIIKDLLFQNFDCGQVHSFLGKPYEVSYFDEANKVLRVKASNTRSNNVVFYKAVQRLHLPLHDSNRRPIEGLNRSYNWPHPVSGQELGLQFEGFETLLTIGVSRWYEFGHYNVNDCTYFDALTGNERTYENGRVLKVTLHYLQKQEYIDHKDDIRKSLQLLIYEILRSVFPHHAQYLLVSTLGDGDPLLPWIFNQFICEDQDAPGTLSFYFTEDAHIDLGLIGALADKDNFGGDYLFRYIYDYLIWLTEGDPVTSSDYDAYLNASNRDKFSFLKFGRDALPDYFDVNLLINFIRDFFCEGQSNVLQGTRERNRQQDVNGVCDFCGAKKKNSEMTALDDGRMRCPACSVDAVDTLEQYNALCEEAKDLFLKYLNIDFSGIKYQTKLVSAVKLHKVYGKPLPITNGYDARKILGLARSRGNIFYVENGRKPMETLGIIVHEMTHIWQFNVPEFAHLMNDQNWVEGLAVWTDLFLTEKKGATNIEEKRQRWLSRNDEYGLGLKFIMDHCPDDPYGYIRHSKPT